MTPSTKIRAGTFILCLAFVAAVSNETAPPSQYAPMEDLEAQIQSYIEQVDEDLANEADFGDEQKDRISKAANTLIVLAQVAGNHDQEHALRKAAPALLKAAQKLAEGASDFAAATAAQAEVKQALTTSSAEKVDWEPVADLAQLMKQVPIVNNKLRSGVNSRRFKQSLDQTAGQATTLAAIAEASAHDTNYCSGDDEIAQWVAICTEVRDAAAAVRTAVRNQDQEAAKAALTRIHTTCDQCHHAFRD